MCEFLTVADHVREAESVVALTGAGLSTASGLPDFRGPSGLWEEYDPSQFSLASFEDDPEKFWSIWTDLIADIQDIDPKPNAGHLALAALEQDSLLEAILTQNADGLEESAGAGSDSVVELHGNAMQTTCPACSHTESVDTSVERFDGNSPPGCPECSTILKPDVVLFGEPLPGDALRRARLLAAGCDLLLVIGTSLTVEPAASIPGLVLDTGGSVVVNNQERTHIDPRAICRTERPAESFLPDLAEALDIDWQSVERGGRRVRRTTDRRGEDSGG